MWITHTSNLEMWSFGKEELCHPKVYKIVLTGKRLCKWGERVGTYKMIIWSERMTLNQKHTSLCCQLSIVLLNFSYFFQLSILLEFQLSWRYPSSIKVLLIMEFYQQGRIWARIKCLSGKNGPLARISFPILIFPIFRKLKMYSILFFILFILFLITTIIVSVILGINIKNEQDLEDQLETCIKMRDSFFFKSKDPSQIIDT